MAFVPTICSHIKRPFLLHPLLISKPLPNHFPCPNLFPLASLPNPHSNSPMCVELLIEGPSPPSFSAVLWGFSNCLLVCLPDMSSRPGPCHMCLPMPRESVAEHMRGTQLSATALLLILWFGCVSGVRTCNWLIHYIDRRLFGPSKAFLKESDLLMWIFPSHYITK